MKKQINSMINLKDNSKDTYINKLDLIYFLNKISTFKLIEIKNAFLKNKNKCSLYKLIEILLLNLDIEFIELPYLIYNIIKFKKYLFWNKELIKFNNLMNFIFKNYYFLENNVNYNCKYNLKVNNPYPIDNFSNKEYIHLDNKNLKYLKIKINYKFSNKFYYISRLNKILLLRIDENKLESINLFTSEIECFLNVQTNYYINHIYYNDKLEILIIVLSYRYLLIKNGSDDFKFELKLDLIKYIKKNIILVININSKNEWYLQDSSYNIYYLNFKNDIIVNKLYTFTKEIIYFWSLKNNLILLKDVSDYIFIIDLIKHRILKKLYFNGKKIRDILFNPLYWMIIFSSFDNNLNFFFINSYLEIDRIDFNINHYGVISNINLINNNKNLVSIDEVGYFKVWDLKTHSCIQNFKLNIDCKKIIYNNNKLIIISQKIFYINIYKTKKEKILEKFVKVEYNEYLREILCLTNKGIKVYDLNKFGQIKYEFKNIFENSIELKDFFITSNYFDLIIININNEVCFFNYFKNKKNKIIKIFDKEILLNFHNKDLKLFFSFSKDNILKVFKDNFKKDICIKELINCNENNKITKFSISKTFNIFSMFNNQSIYLYYINDLEIINIHNLDIKDEKIKNILFYDNLKIFVIVLKYKLIFYYYGNFNQKQLKLGYIQFENIIKKSIIFYDKIILLVNSEILIIKSNALKGYYFKKEISKINFNLNVKKNFFNFYIKKPMIKKINIKNINLIEFQIKYKFAIKSDKVISFKIFCSHIKLIFILYFNENLEIFNFKGVKMYIFDLMKEIPNFINFNALSKIDKSSKKYYFLKTQKILNKFNNNIYNNYNFLKIQSKIKKYINFIQNSEKFHFEKLKKTTFTQNNLFLKNYDNSFRNDFTNSHMKLLNDKLYKKKNEIDNLADLNNYSIKKNKFSKINKKLFLITKNKKLKNISQNFKKEVKCSIKNKSICQTKKYIKSDYLQLIQNLNKKVDKVKYKKYIK